MKRLILLRHAKSEDPIFTKPDYNRQLKEKGIKDIKKVAEKFSELKYQADLILCSSAIRTKETIVEFDKHCTLKKEVKYLDQLYHASAGEILDQINLLGKENNCIIVVGHNFGISNLAERLSETSCPELPTSGMAILEFTKTIEPGIGKLKHFIFPKEL